MHNLCLISYLPIIISGLSFSGSQEARRSDRTEMSSCEDGCKKGTMLDLLFRTLIHIIPKWEIHLRPSRHYFSTSCGPWQSFKPPLRPSQLFGVCCHNSPIHVGGLWPSSDHELLTLRGPLGGNLGDFLLKKSALFLSKTRNQRYL